MKKKLLFAAALFAVFFGGLALIAAAAETDAAHIRAGVLRFHVIANSDSAEDQENKLCVRDGIAALCASLFENSSGKQEAMSVAQQHRRQIETLAEQILRQRGCNDTVSVCVRQRFFPTRRYDGVSLPAGVYDTLDVQIGAAAGHNFWCVMFPAICVGACDARSNREKMADVLDGGALEMTTSEPTVSMRFKLVEFLENCKHFWTRPKAE